jgi:hypothetical protein
MHKIERVLKMKLIKEWGQYFIENSFCTKDNKNGVTLTKENRKLNTMLIGKCNSCGANFFGKFDSCESMDSGIEHTVDCPNESCAVRMKFVDGSLFNNGEKPPKPVEVKVEEPVLPPEPDQKVECDNPAPEQAAETV